MALISCTDAAFGYETGVVISGLNFEVKRGDYLCIVGENGSGKSTLVKGLLHLKKPVFGSVSMGDGLAQSEIGYLPQQSKVQKDFPAGVLEVVLSGRQNKSGLRPFYDKEDKRAALENMARLGILDIKNSCFRELSGGQQQRVLLARALSATTKLLLLDEPAVALDPPARQELYGLIHKLNAEEGLTVVMVSHDMSSALEYASHVLHLGSRQLFFGTRQDYLKTTLAQRFIGGDDDA